LFFLNQIVAFNRASIIDQARSAVNDDFRNKIVKPRTFFAACQRGKPRDVLLKSSWRWRSAAVPATARSTINNSLNSVRSSGNPGCCGWDTRAPFHFGNTPRASNSVAARERAGQGNWAEQPPQGCEREWKVAFHSAAKLDIGANRQVIHLQ
jgi:hypothetical protein